MPARELEIPHTAAANGFEVLRAFVVNGDLGVSIIRAFEKPDIWGIFLADVARHAARIFARETNIAYPMALEKICTMFDAEMRKPTDLGRTEEQRRN